MNILEIIGRQQPLLRDDLYNADNYLKEAIAGARILVIGAAGSIGQAVTYELFRYEPKALHVVDLSENNLVELVRTVRSTIGYNSSAFKTFALDCAGNEFDALCSSGNSYDYIFNLSAMKHVRSESDPFTLMRMVDVNIFNSVKIAKLAKEHSAKKYFCVSTDKAANPVNMMGASKRIMEYFLMRESLEQDISMARFANVAFSDGSLLHGFNQRFVKRQPIAAPYDVKRYFITPEESGQLCVLSGLLGENREIFFPKLVPELHLERFSNIAIRFLDSLGYDAYECDTEDEARAKTSELIPKMKWPVYFFESDTTGEKDFEEFFMPNEHLLMDRYNGIGIVRSHLEYDYSLLDKFETVISNLKSKGIWDKQEIVDLFHGLLPEFNHIEKGKYLDDRM